MGKTVIMKKLLPIIFFLCFAAFAIAQVQPYNITLQQRNSTDTGYITRPLSAPDSSADGIIYYNGTTQLPGYVVLGGGLSIGSGVLSSTTASPVNADWNASSGLAQILNKPTIPAAQVNSDWNASSGVASILNKPTIPAAQVSSDWNAVSGVTAILNKPTIPTITPFNYGAPNTRTLAMTTAYQATDITKAAVVTVSPQCTNTVSVISPSACTMTVRIASSTLTCSTGTVVSTWTSTYALGLSLIGTTGSPIDIKLPTGWYFILCSTAGTFTINTAIDQSAS